METLNPNPNSNSNSNSNLNSPNKRLKIETLTLDPPIPPSSDKGKAPIIAAEYDCGESEDGYESPPKSTPESCGVCLTEDGKTARGVIDSCDHYFCFLCIIEWSKIESRCPLCRGRFSTIRRVRKDGSFIGNGFVRIPVRDQIYDPVGEPVDPYAQAKCTICNGTTDESLLLLCDLCDSPSHTYCVGLGATVPEGDWYCSDCALLRAEQPDYVMDDNAVTSAVLDHGDEPSSTSTSTSALISIFDIVRDPSVPKEPDSGTNRLRKLVSQNPTKFSSAALISDQPNIASAKSLTIARGNLHSSADMSESSARTLRNCRNVHRHIHILRENWDGFRAGSLSFPFAFSDSFGKVREKTNGVGTSVDKSCKLQLLSSMSSLQSEAVGSLCDTARNKESYNVDRAWKLMTIAKTAQQRDKSKSSSKASQNKAHSIKRDKCVVSGRKDLMSPQLEQRKPTDSASGKPAQSTIKNQVSTFVSLAASTSGSKLQKSCVRKFPMPRENIYSNRACLASHKKLQRKLSTNFDDGSAGSGSSGGPIPGASDVYCSRLQRPELSAHPMKQVEHLNICASAKGELQTSVQADICHDRTGLYSHANLGRGLSDLYDEQNGFTSSTSSYDPIAGDPDASHVKLDGKKLSACPGKVGAKSTGKYTNKPVAGGSHASHVKLEGNKIAACPGKVGDLGVKIISKDSNDDEAKGEIQSLVKINLELLSNKHLANSKIISKDCNDDETKGEIQSLVKLNLKLLSKDKQLGVDAFKEIARLSTHTILASCGFEHRKIVRSLPTLVCHHSDQTRQQHRSTIVPSSCKECFYVFVKDVVNSIMSEKLNSAKVAS